MISRIIICNFCGNDICEEYDGRPDAAISIVAGPSKFTIIIGSDSLRVDRVDFCNLGCCHEYFSTIKHKKEQTEWNPQI